MDQSSSASPSLTTSKRRYTSAFGSQQSQPSESPQKRAKRTKTLNTCGAGRNTYLADDDARDGLKDGAAAPSTSQSVRFSDHSHVNSSAGLASELAKHSDFANHEPNEMFRDTGSTVADNSSEQQRLLEQALGSKSGASTSMAKDIRPEEQRQSSPFPWSTAEENVDKPNGSRQRSSQRARERPSFKLQPSPRVEIPQEIHAEATPTKQAPSSTQKSTKGRKHKVEQDDNTDPLNSDDRAIGLPKERYQPRPSRRRATQIEEAPIDFSVRPEKAAKVKRVKSANTEEGATAGEVALGTNLTDRNVDGAAASAGEMAHNQPSNGPEPGSPEYMAKIIAKLGTTGKAEPQKDVSEEAEAKSPQTVENGTKVVEQASEDKIFVRPAKPAPKSKSAKRSKRAHTTIFEDHVEFTGSQSSPNLSQQQAKRASALQDVQNGAKSKSRKKIVIDDEDKMDELAAEADEGQLENSPPKRRGRGRPPRSTAKPPSKSEEKVMDESEGEEGNQPDEDESSKKRGRGRPRKATEESQSKAVEDDAFKHTSGLNAPAKPLDGSAKQDASVDSSPPNMTSSAANIPTPSPEKPAPTPQEQAKASSPESHSPIKPSSKVPLRVGLSKRNRIPSLLRVMKPPPKRT